MKEQTFLHSGALCLDTDGTAPQSTSCSWISLAYSSLFIPAQRVVHEPRLTPCYPVSLTRVTVVPLSLLAWSLQSHHIVDQANAMSCFRYCLSYFFFLPSLEDRTSCLPPTPHIWRCADMIRSIIPTVPSLLWEMWLTGLDTVSRIWQPRQVLQTTQQVKTKSPPL